MAKITFLHVYRECEKYLCETWVENSRCVLDNLNALLSAVKGNCWCWWPLRESVLGLWCVSNKSTLSSAPSSAVFLFPFLSSITCAWEAETSQWVGKTWRLQPLSVFPYEDCRESWDPTPLPAQLPLVSSSDNVKGGDSTFSEQLQLVLPFLHGQ